jgi:hypothetical protein
MPSSDIFQGFMSKIFYDFDDVIVYIDNIILFTTKSFNYHLTRLSSALARIKTQNLHIHVEDSFLASQEVDYLGYTLSSKGIKPQYNKIVALLALDEPKNKKQLRSFLGFVNFYRQLWYHRSHIFPHLLNSQVKKLNGLGVPSTKKLFNGSETPLHIRYY